MPKKKKAQMPETTQKKSKKILIAGSIFITALILIGIYGFISVKEEQPEYVQKNVINNYVCKVVGMDSDQNMFAVECLTK